MVKTNKKTRVQRFTPEEIVTARYYMPKEIKTFNKLSVVRCVVGCSMIAIGIITTPIPFTTIPLLIGGGAMLGYDVLALYKKVKYEAKLLRMRWLK